MHVSLVYRWTLCLTVACSAAAFAQEKEYSDAERSHWSLRPPTRPHVPQFTAPADRAFVHTPVDAFILARLKGEQLAPAAEASRHTLARRVYFDLTGLPPTPEELAEFLADRSPDAYERLVDRLLASPRYGERWAQHWLDVVRYAETEGFEYDRHRVGAWRYRDYVVRSLNADKPFDRFMLEQLAGDEIAADAPNPADPELHVAAGFHRLGPVRRNAGNMEVAFSRNEVLTEMTDIVGSAFFGLTLGCARCHDHMFDPIRQRDYYQMQAFLASTHEHDMPLAEPGELAQWQAKFDQANAALKRLKEQAEDAEGEVRKRLEREIKEAEKQLPVPLDSLSSVRNQTDQRTPIRVLARGSTEQAGELVAPRALGVLLPEGAATHPADLPRPRTALARWIVAPEHPLTARVLANRVWQYHFGQGLVRTANDFGANGESPSHAELLDYLASELVAGQWQLKPLHRTIVLSSTYRQASVARDEDLARRVDPRNRLLSRFSRRRLSAEELRDAMLAVAGRLNAKQGGPSIMVPVERELVDLLYKPSQWEPPREPREFDRRSLYLIAKRNLRLPFLEVFDRPDLQTSCFRRESSTHAPQALELLNGDLASDLAQSLAQRLREEAGDDPQRQISLAFELTAGRPPTSDELRLARAFLARTPLREFALAMFNLNAFIYVD